jgi:DNA-binding LacI/PurR family transcriptional regulator
MKTNTATIKEIAMELGISTSTVSRALRGLPEIKRETREAVIRVAQALDYQPNQLAKNLVKSSTKTIGVIVPGLNLHFFASVLTSIEEAALQAGYSVIICQTHESYLRELSQIENLMNSKVEGLIISLACDTSHFEHIEKLIRKKMPVVLFDRHSEELNVSKVIVDNIKASCEATEHLISNGCKRLACLAGPSNMLISNQRVEGFKLALKKHNLPFYPQYVSHGDFSHEYSMLQTFNLINLPNPPDGILVVSDRIAFSTLHALKQKGVKVPDEIAVVSFNNEPFCNYFTPSVSSVNQPIQEIGRESVKLLLKQIESENPVAETVMLETQLVIRESSMRIYQ